MQGILTGIRAQEGGGAAVGITLQDPRDRKNSDFALAFEAGSERSTEQLNGYVDARTIVMVWFKGTRGKDATAYRVDPSVSGLVVDIQEVGGRTDLTIQDGAGKRWVLVYEPEPGHEFPVSHLREHMEEMLPVRAFYRERGDTLVTYLLADAE